MSWLHKRTLVGLSLAGILLSSGESARAEEAANRIFGVIPNYTTVDNTASPSSSGPAPEAVIVSPVTTSQSFKLATLSSFDPYVFPFVGVVAGIGQGSGSNYGARYGTAMADNAIGNFMTTGVMPSLTHQDPRYFRSGEGSVMHRFAYALSRSVVTRTRSGEATFNISEIGGNAIAAGLSNLYYGPADRTLAGTMDRWGMQVMWDTVGNELKEFWPDIRHKLLHK